MKFNTLAIILAIISISFSSVSAQGYYEGPNRKERKELAKSNIEAMKGGVLLVRLQNYNKKVEAMQSRGMQEKADEVLREQKEKHQEIMQAFKTSFQFCKVYFFYSDNTTQVKDGKFDGILFDAEMNKVSPELSEASVFVLDSERAYLDGLDSNQIGFTVLDSEMEHLGDPFPYVVRKRKGTVVSERTYPVMVETLEAQLTSYYQKTQGIAPAKEKKKRKKKKKKESAS